DGRVRDRLRGGRGDDRDDEEMAALTLQGAAPLVDWAVASRSHPDQRESGDRHVVAPFASGVLLGAVDGLGHGTGASRAARAALALLEAHRGEPLPDRV